MIYVDEAINKRKCTKCGFPIEAGNKCMHFSGGSGRSRTENNLCIYCMIEFIIADYSNNVSFNKLKQDYLTNKVINNI